MSNVGVGYLLVLILACTASAASSRLYALGVMSVTQAVYGTDRNRWSEGVSYTHFDLSEVCTIHTMKSADLCRLLEKAGWVLARTRGSHRQYIKDGRTVTVPHPKKDLGVGLVKAIRKQTGL